MKKLFVKELEGDMLTPIGIYHSITGSKKCLLESSLKHEQQGRYSFIGCNPGRELVSADGATIVLEGGDSIQKEGRFLDVLSSFLQQESVHGDSPFPLVGGAIGYIGYDMIRQYEEIGGELPDCIQMPDAHLLFYQDIVVYDHILQRAYILSAGSDQEEAHFQKRAAEIAADIYRGVKPQGKKAESGATVDFNSHLSKEKFMAMVEAAKKAIVAGEVFQIVLSSRFSAPFEGDSFSFYRSLRRNNPSPYMYYIDFGDYQVVGSSPESLLKGDRETVYTNPIAGTRKRGRSPEEDGRLQSELLRNEKELAEHMMLVDLGRNDLGRVCRIGSVELVKYMLIEKYSHVMHMVSEVRGIKNPGISNEEVLASCLPAGTVSGAPKIRAMNLINQLEAEKRGLYGGAVGYFSYSGRFDFALAIRTMVVKESKAYIQAGAGIVYDSDPAAEFGEILHKAKALMEVEV
ncbi:anthranilate synthase component I [Bacillus testis]|uniref:anthranilate synthase component I n=1 Tax=Bacillus testis TaxID=1622072 RepID=UPI00067F6EDC|nr:anthranilate synthase component I [Bacillus testis]